jgi:hypothetical protein
MSDVGRSRRTVVVGAVILLVAVALAAVVVLVTTLGRDDSDPSASPTAPPSVAPTSDAANASVCGLDGYEETDTLDQAPENDWELVGTVAAPTDPDGAGPGLVEQDGFRSCYAHTAEGALFAAVSYVAVNSDVRNTPRLYELLASGPIRDRLQASPPPGDPSSSRLQVAGFKINRYSPDESIVDVAWKVTSEGGTLVSVPTILKWESGDWKIYFSDGSLSFAPTALDNLGGYIPWSGV